MRRLVLVLATALLAVATGTVVLAAQPRLASQSRSQSPGDPVTASLKRALVIGNGAYAIGPLENTRADAALIAEALRKTGFDVTLARDLDRTAMFQAVRTFAASLPAGAASVIYFAGHGMQIDDQNYLVPVDMVPSSPVAAGLKSVSLKAVYEQLAGARSRINVIILDACRNNPFEPRVSSKTRAFGMLGLAPPPVPRGTLIAYATAPGQLAADGNGHGHSLYSQTLSELLGKDGMPIEEVFKTLADRVRRATLEDQQPWYESSLVGTFYFGAPVVAGDEVQAGHAPQMARGASKRSMQDGRAPADLPVGHAGAAAWYRTLNELEWTELDNRMSQRAGYASADQIPALQAQAAKNNVVAITTLAMLYRAGTRSGTDITSGHRFRSDANLTRAVALYRKAAMLGFPVAQAELGEMLYQGREVDMDRQEGQRLLEQAAQANYPRASIDLAQIRLERSGSPNDAATMMNLLIDGATSIQKQAAERR